MAHLQGLMVTGTWIDRRLIQIQLRFYVMGHSRVWLVVGWEVYRVFAVARTRARAGNSAPLRIGFRLKLEAMSR